MSEVNGKDFRDMTIGERLSVALKQKNMTQKELSVKAGISEAAISRIMSKNVRRSRRPRPKTLYKITKALELREDYFSIGNPNAFRSQWFEEETNEKFDEEIINETVVCLIGEWTQEIWNMDGENQDHSRLLILGYIRGVLEMAKAMKDVLKS